MVIGICRQYQRSKISQDRNVTHLTSRTFGVEQHFYLISYFASVRNRSSYFVLVQVKFLPSVSLQRSVCATQFLKIQLVICLPFFGTCGGLLLIIFSHDRIPTTLFFTDHEDPTRPLFSFRGVLRLAFGLCRRRLRRMY